MAFPEISDSNAERILVKIITLLLSTDKMPKIRNIWSKPTPIQQSSKEGQKCYSYNYKI